MLSLRVSKEGLSTSFNSQDQAPDDPCHVQDSECAPCDVFSTSSPFSQGIPRLVIRFSTELRQIPFDFLSSDHQNPVRIPPSRPQANSRKEFNDHLPLWEVFSTYDVVNWIPTTVPLSRVTTKCHIPQYLKSTFIYFPTVIRNHPIRDSGAPRFIFVVYGLELLVSVWCMFIVMVLVTSSYLFVRVCFFNDSYGSFIYISFCTYHLPKCHLMGLHV